MVNILDKIRFGKIPSDRVEQDNIERLGLVYEVSHKSGSFTRMPQMLEQLIKMTQQTLNASAASVLLFRDNDQELYFEAASGPVGKALKQVKLNTRYGIAGQVARTGKPIIVNDVSRSCNFHKMIDDTTGYFTKSLICAPLSVDHKILGVIEVLNKLDGNAFGEHDLEAVISIANTAAMAIEDIRLNQTLMDAYKNTLTTIAAAIDAKDPYTRGHSIRVMEYSLKAGASLNFTTGEMDNLEYAGILHDIGKIAVDSTILNKLGPLTPPEWEIVRAHPAIGAGLLIGTPFLQKAGELVLYHHERYDGKGYPNGAKGEDIPLGARLIAVAEAFDTMTTDRAHRSALSIDNAVKELHDCSGSQFCPTAVKALIAGLHLNALGK
jgi:putative methionine-R-sulfoxide reductase with GAF domain